MSDPDSSGTGLSYRAEVRRKFLHLFALTIPLGYIAFERHKVIGVLLVALTFSVLADLARLRDWQIQRLWSRFTDSLMREREAEGFTGATHILLAGCLCRALFSVPAATLAMSVIIFGDIAAALIGRRWGRHRLIGTRSIEGSLSFFFAASIPGLLINGIEPFVGLSAAALATIVEALSRRIDDNLSVPLVVGLYVHIMLVIA